MNIHFNLSVFVTVSMLLPGFLPLNANVLQLCKVADFVNRVLSAETNLTSVRNTSNIALFRQFYIGVVSGSCFCPSVVVQLSHFSIK